MTSIINNSYIITIFDHMANQDIDKKNLKQCLQLLITVVSNTINILERQTNQSNEKHIL
ncbi:unnamed protein product, partial [Rotaria sordida]